MSRIWPGPLFWIVVGAVALLIGYFVLGGM